MNKIVQIKQNGVKCFPKVKKEILTARLNNRYSQSQSAAWQNEKVQLNDYTACGTQLKLENGNVKIGKGIKKVLVSGQVAFFQNNHPPKQLLQATLMKNGQTITYDTEVVAANIGQTSCVLAPNLIEVSEGDLIQLGTNYGASLTPYMVLELGTYLTVEVVE